MRPQGQRLDTHLFLQLLVHVPAVTTPVPHACPRECITYSSPVIPPVFALSVPMWLAFRPLPSLLIFPLCNMNENS